MVVFVQCTLIKKLSALTKKQWIDPMTVTFKCLQRTEHTVDETNPGHLTVNQSEPSYSATKMHLFVLLALEHQKKSTFPGSFKSALYKLKLLEQIEGYLGCLPDALKFSHGDSS